MSSTSDESELTSECESTSTSDLDGRKTRNIKTNLCASLDSVKPLGDIAYSRSIDSCPNPVLHVQDVGVLGLPLSARDARALIDACHQSPFGKGTETLVDTSVRKCWELNGDQFELRNPHWPATLQGIVADVVRGLGVWSPNQVKAEKYKLLLYEEGAFFLPHQDSPKAERMFGTLVICLPSKHEGGDVVLTHGGKTQIFSSSVLSEFQTSYAAWYSDVTHEVKPVTSGYRLVLTYNLIQTGGGRLAVPSVGDSRLEMTLKYWKALCDAKDDCPSILAYKLSHEYSLSGLGFDNLKGTDEQRAQNLRFLCERHDFNLYLASIEREVEGSVEDEEDYSYYGYGRRHRPRSTRSFIDIIEDKLSIKRAVDVDGMVTTKDLVLEKGDFVQKDALSGTPDEEDFSGYTGNEGATATHIYRKTALVLVPKSCSLFFRFRKMRHDSSAMKAWVGKLLRFLSTSHNQGYREEFEALSALILNYCKRFPVSSWGWSSRAISDDILEDVAMGLIQLGDFESFEMAVSQHAGSLSPSLVSRIIQEIPVRRFAGCRTLMAKAVSKEKKGFRSQCDLITKLVSGCLSTLKESETQERQDIEAWRRQRIDEALRKTDMFSKADAPFLAKVVTCYPGEALFQRVSDIVLGPLQDSSFVSSFMDQICTDAGAGKIEMKWVQRLYKGLLSRMMPKQTSTPGFSGSAQGNRFLNPYGGYGPATDTLARQRAGKLKFSVPLFLRWLEDCRALRIDVGPFLGQLKAWVLTTDDIELAFHHVVFPVIKGLVAQLDSDYAAVVTAGLSGSDITELIFLYKSRYVLKEPAKAPTMSFQPMLSPCLCAECQTFNSFLLDRNRIKCEIRAGKPKRDHVEGYISFNRAFLEWETIKDRSPHLLRITFRNRAMEVKHREWEDRARKAVSQIQSLGPKSRMETIMKPEDYQAALKPDGMIMTPSDLARYMPTLRAIENQTATPLNPLSNTIAGQKRPNPEPDSRPSKKPFTEVVDLT